MALRRGLRCTDHRHPDRTGQLQDADAEGLALAPAGRTGGYLVASSQGDNAYKLYHLPNVTYAGGFRIGTGAIDGTSDTDGIELVLGNYGPDFLKGCSWHQTVTMRQIRRTSNMPAEHRY